MNEPIPKAPGNLIDKIVGFFNPRAGMERIVMREAYNRAGGYIGGKLDRRFTKNWLPGGGDANSDILDDLQTLRERSRDACRNIPLAIGMKKTALTYTIGTGLMHHARPVWRMLPIKDEKAQAKWTDETEAKFLSWCMSKECDLQRRKNFFKIQKLAKGSELESGDAFALLVPRKSKNSKYALTIQLIEADRVANPNNSPDTDTLVEGVKLDENGTPIGIWVQTPHPGAHVRTKATTWEYFQIDGPFGRKNVIHLVEELRPDQIRGVPFLAPFLEQIKNADDYRDAEQKAAIIASWLTVIVKTMNGEGFGSPTGVVTNGSAKSNGTGSNPELGPGIITALRPGEDVTVVNPGRPNSNFGPFLQSIVEHLGMGSEIPYEVLLKHYSSSFSASRAAQQEAFRAFKGPRDAFSTDFCHEVYCAWLSEAVAIGDIQAPGYFEDPEIRRAWQGDEWTGDAPISIDPLAEAQAVRERTEVGLTTMAEEIAAYSGKDWREVFEQRKTEREALLSAGLIQESAQPGAKEPPVPPSKKEPPK